ncbi:MAG: bifunctional metallophosphatase/5'-nucleotidase [Selenomonas sp.]|uniref:bifunctional metallophosphatase/5'-nucleotidase n=2 Tax=Selenomonas sp. TaxID=2053611 RepID=UPI0025ED8DBE|nr:bifunctional UDP-sugar hydrolase/5'-nucleotidase [Selenomonas sp.]MCI6085169.1 bifunctional metallophosphatase/5'-nucleotidase [Selenomonas sp.]
MNKKKAMLFRIALSLWTAVLLFASPAYASVQSDGVHIQILHTNDIHARVEPGADDGKGIGMPELAGVFWAARDKEPDTLVLDAGDTFHGMPIINVTRGDAMVGLMNIAGYDAMAPGNHDYNYGADRLVELSKKTNFPVLSANTVYKKSGQLVFRAYKIFDCSGVKVGVFGLTTPETAVKTNPTNVMDVAFFDPVVCAKAMTALLRDDGCQVVIGLMHMGLDVSSAVTSQQIAAEVPGLDVIIDGHSHTELPTGLAAGDALICQTGWHGHNVGAVELVVNDGKVTSKTAKLWNLKDAELIAPVPDPGTLEAMKLLKKTSEQEFAKVVAQSPKKLSGERALSRVTETELGNLSADAMRAAAGADIAFMNGGGIRTDLPKGEVTQGDLMNIFPFGNTLEKLELTGAEVRAALEHSVASVPSPFGGFLQVSGLAFTYDSSRAAGSRVQSVTVDGLPMDDAQTYTVAVNDFLAAGGDGYDMWKGAPVVGAYGTLEEIVASYLEQHGTSGIELGRIVDAAKK